MKYNLKKIALLAEIIGGIAIVISLIFVGIQFRENTKATKSATATNTIGAMTSWYSDMGNDEQSSALFWNFMVNPDSLSPTQRFQVVMNLHGLWLTFQNSYYLAEEGTLDLRIHKSLTETIYGVKNQPGFQYYWKTRKSIFFEEFRNYIDNALESDKIASKGLYSNQKPKEKVISD